MWTPGRASGRGGSAVVRARVTRLSRQSPEEVEWEGRRWEGRDGPGGWTFSVASVGTLPVILEGVRLHGRAVPRAEAW